MIKTPFVANGATYLLPNVDTATDRSPTYRPNGLGEKLARRDPGVLGNRVFNIPPSVQVYPGWLRGLWNVTTSFRGYAFPSQTIPREELVRNYNIAGFQKCSIAVTADVGKERVDYQWRVDEVTGWEDRRWNLARQIDAFLGYTAVKNVIYDPRSNANRIGIDFVDYRTVNAERIELFCNSREAEEYRSNDGLPIFVCSEYLRQVTFGTGNVPGVPRQAITTYANFWTWRMGTDDGYVTGNLLTAAYLDPQDPLYFREPTLPVAIYSHDLNLTRTPL